MTEYYVRSDGTVSAGNKAQATSSASADTSLSMATFNASTFAALDIVYFSDQGGPCNVVMTIPSSGDDADDIIQYKNVADETVTLSAPNLSTLILVDGKSNISVDGFSVISTSINEWVKAINLIGTISDVSFSNIAVDMSGATVNNYAFGCSAAATNITLSYLAHNDSPKHAVYFSGISENISLDHITGVDSGADDIAIYHATNITLSDIISTNTTLIGVNLNDCSGLLSVDSVTIAQAGSQSFNVEDSTFDVGSKIKNASVSNGSSWGFVTDNTDNVEYLNCNADDVSYGFYSKLGSTGIDHNDCTSTKTRGSGFWADGTSSGLTYTNCITQNGDADGFGVTDSVSDVTYKNNIARYNGDPDSTSEGDGFTAHSTNSDIKYYSNLAFKNTCTGFALVGASTGVLYGNTSINNGTGVAQNRAELYLNMTGGAGWIAKNNIFMNTNSYLLVKITNGSYLTADYNVYISDIAPTGAPFDIGGTGKTWTEWIAAVGNETNSIFIHKNGSQYDVYKGSAPTVMDKALDYDPIKSTGEPVNKTDNPILAMNLWIDGVNNGGEEDIRGRKVFGLPIPGCYQGVDIPKKGGGGWAPFGSGDLR